MNSSTNDFTVPERVREQVLDDDPVLCRHIKRPQWGLAILAWESDGRRAYQFEDGRLRNFKEGYYDMLQPAKSEQRSEEAVIIDLQAAIGSGLSTEKVLTPVATFEQQVEIFKKIYPKGFAGEKWTEEHRSTPNGRDLKRHRDPVIAKAQDKLSADSCAELLGNDKFGDVNAAVLDILGGTSLVGLSDVKVLRTMDDETGQRFAETLVELLHGEGDFSPRFKAWIDVLEKTLEGKPSWRITTVLPALLSPEEHVCVRHSAFIRQAASIAPSSKYTQRPTAGAYRNFQRVARVVLTRLEAAGHEPRDLMDVHDFVWATLRDSALEHLGS